MCRFAAEESHRERGQRSEMGRVEGHIAEDYSVRGRGLSPSRTGELGPVVKCCSPMQGSFCDLLSCSVDSVQGIYEHSKSRAMS